MDQAEEMFCGTYERIETCIYMLSVVCNANEPDLSDLVEEASQNVCALSGYPQSRFVRNYYVVFIYFHVQHKITLYGGTLESL